MKGSQVAECVVFISTMVLWALYLSIYFEMHYINRHWLSRLGGSGGGSGTGGKKRAMVNLWRTALKTRETWARDLMSKSSDAKGEALLAVQQMRNIIVACTLLVMGMAQVMGRLINVMTNPANLDKIAAIALSDPITGADGSWAQPYVVVAVPLGATLVSLLCFGQAVRLAVHIGFNVRVQGVTGGKGLDRVHDSGRLQLDDEVVVMVQRCELYFTLGLRFLYLFIGTIFWMLGATALLVSSLTVLLLLVMSDVLIVPARQPGSGAAVPEPADSSQEV